MSTDVQAHYIDHDGDVWVEHSPDRFYLAYRWTGHVVKQPLLDSKVTLDTLIDFDRVARGEEL